MLPGGQLLASGDESGELAVKDLRMLGQSSSSTSKQTVWTRRGGLGPGPGSGISCLAVGPKPSGTIDLCQCRSASLGLSVASFLSFEKNTCVTRHERLPLTAIPSGEQCSAV